jgi:hypothetical protein
MGHIFRRITELKPWWYLIAYLVAIFAFATAFWSCSNEFYHPYVIQEAPFKDESSWLKEEVTEPIRAVFSANSQLGDGFAIQAASVRIAALNITEYGVSLGVPILITKNDQPVLMAMLPLIIQVGIWKELPKADGTTNVEFQVAIDPQRVFPLPDESPSPAIPQQTWHEIQVRLKKIVGKIEVSQDVQETINSLASANRGYPNKIPGVYWRLVYLSAITITTVGYGDIVPISGLTRLLVAIEATFGIVLLGLFVNSVVSYGRPTVGSSKSKTP